MATRITQSDRWARVLAVSNDAAAIAALNSLASRLEDMAHLTLQVRVTLRHAPDAEITAAVKDAHRAGINLYGSTNLVRQKFEAHERGGR
jgi:hypothetical protein